MAPKKKVTGLIKLQINAGAANPAPPIGPALGQHGVNIMEFCKAYNAATESQRGNVVPVEITVYEDRSFTFILKTPPAAELIKKAAGVQKASATPHTVKVGKITKDQVRQIATGVSAESIAAWDTVAERQTRAAESEKALGTAVDNELGLDRSDESRTHAREATDLLALGPEMNPRSWSEQTADGVQAIREYLGSGADDRGWNRPADVTAAQQDMQRLRNEAETYANRVVPEARGEAARIERQAEAFRTQTVEEAKGQAARFTQVYDEYAKAPAVTRERIYLETMERVFGGMEKVIIDQNGQGQGVIPYLPLTEMQRRQAAPTQGTPR